MRVIGNIRTAIISLVVVLFGWWMVVTVFAVPEYLFPNPAIVIRHFFADWRGYSVATLLTLAEAALGLILALSISFALAVLFSFSARLDRHINPLLVAMQSIPILAIAPLLTLWFGPGFVSKVIASFLVCFFPLAAGWSSGIKAVSADEKDLFFTLGATRIQIARWLSIPRALPYFFAGLRVAAPLSVLGAIVGEFVGATSGLGFLILSYSYYARTADIFVCIVIVAACGMCAYRLVILIERRMVFWQGQGRGECQ